MKTVEIHMDQKDVSYLKTESYTYDEMESMTYAELQNKYNEVVVPKSKSIRLVEPIKEVTI